MIGGFNEETGMYHCFRCGHELIIEGNYMGSDMGDCSEDEDEDYMVTTMSCPYCGARMECADISNNQKKEYPYFQETEK